MCDRLRNGGGVFYGQVNFILPRLLLLNRFPLPYSYSRDRGVAVDRIMAVARGVANGRGVVYDWVVNTSMIPDRYYSSPSLNKSLIHNSYKVQSANAIKV